MIQITWLEKLFRPLIIALMIGVVMVALVRVIRMVMPQWDGTYLVAGAMLVSLEAYYSHFLLERTGLRGLERIRFRLTEVGVLFLLIRAGSYLGKGWAALRADVLYWPSHPSAFLLDGESLVAFVLALMAWSTTLQLAVDLGAVDMPLLDPGEGGSAPGGPERILYAHRFEPRESLPLESFIGRFVFGGMVLLAATGIARLGVGPLLEGQGARGSRIEATLLLYFVLGLVMMAQIRYAALRRQWWIEGVSVTSDVTGRWVRYTLLLLAAAALLAFLLPTQPALGVLVVAGGVLDLIMWVGAFVVFLLFLLIMFPLFYLWWLLTRFFSEEGETRRSPLPRRSRPPSCPTWWPPRPTGTRSSSFYFFGAWSGGRCLCCCEPTCAITRRWWQLSFPPARFACCGRCFTRSGSACAAWQPPFASVCRTACQPCAVPPPRVARVSHFSGSVGCPRASRFFIIT